MSGAVFAYTEGVVRPDIFHRLLHKGCHAHGGLHIVREYEECATTAPYAAVESDTVHDTSHGELAHAGLKECAGEVAFGESVGLLEEAVGLVAVGKVGRRYDHVANFLGENAEHIGRSLTC